jgi:hypothetical protein
MLAGGEPLDAAVQAPRDERDECDGNDGCGYGHFGFPCVESAIVMQPGVGPFQLMVRLDQCSFYKETEE